MQRHDRINFFLKGGSYYGSNYFYRKLYDYYTILDIVKIIQDVIDSKLQGEDIGFYWWWHYEPYIEFTYCLDGLVDTNPEHQNIYKFIQTSVAIYFNILFPSTKGNWEYLEDIKPGWYHENYEEYEFEVETLELSAKIAQSFFDFEEGISKGKGVDLQYQRKCHILACQLGMTYWQEAKNLLSRALICILFCLFKHERAVWIHKNIFRQRY